MCLLGLVFGVQVCACVGACVTDCMHNHPTNAIIVQCEISLCDDERNCDNNSVDSFAQNLNLGDNNDYDEQIGWWWGVPSPPNSLKHLCLFRRTIFVCVDD